jgi:Fur family ferric uptake transcriptional regulator
MSEVAPAEILPAAVAVLARTGFGVDTGRADLADRLLKIVGQAGVVHRVMGSDEHARSELAEELAGRYHHLVCVSCGVVEDFEAPQRVEPGLAEAIGRFASETGFRAETHRLDLLGTCERCAD